MDDLISRAAAIKGLLSMCPEKAEPGSFDEYGATVLCGAVDVVIKGLPAVAAAPVVHGYWVEEPDRQRHWHCSNCGKVQGITCVVMKYCPECGARMAEHPWAASGCGQAFSPD